MRARYTIWDGTRDFSLDADALFDRLADHLHATGDLSDALARLLDEGMAGDGFEFAGLDELADRVRDELSAMHERYDLSRSLEQPWNDADDVVALEEEAAAREPDDGERRRRRDALEKLSRVLEERMAELGRWSFADGDAADGFERLREREADIAKVERFQRRFRAQFQGPESLGFDETLEMIERYERLRELERALRERDLESLDPDGLEESMGRDFARSVGTLKQALRALVEAGYLVQKGGHAALTPKAARRLGRLALKELVADLAPDAAGRHDTSRRGPSEVQLEQSRTWEFGDPLAIDVAATLRSALLREAAGAQGTAGAARPGRAPGSIDVEPGDVHVHETRRTTRTSTVLLLDMSWSMSWDGRFAAAKKVALALETLMRTRYPRDWFGMVGFYTRAVELKPADLAEVTWNMGDPFTNLQDGLRLASHLLDRHPAATRQVIVITDGQPTAYFSEGKLFCEWPMGQGGLSSRATTETLKEVERVTRKGVRINTFMLDDSPLLRAFVQKMTAINRGRAFYTTPDSLGRFVLVDHVGRRRKVL